MSEVLEHLTDDVLERTIVEVHRVLVAEGHFIGTVPARENLIDQANGVPVLWEKISSMGTPSDLRSSTAS